MTESQCEHPLLVFWELVTMVHAFLATLKIPQIDICLRYCLKIWTLPFL